MAGTVLEGMAEADMRAGVMQEAGTLVVEVRSVAGISAEVIPDSLPAL